MAAEEFVDWYMKIDAAQTEWSEGTIAINKYMIGAEFSGPRYQARMAVASAALKKGFLPFWK
jgi:hypothetical protein